MAPTDKEHLGVDVHPEVKQYLKVAAFHGDMRVSEYVRLMIERDMKKHPDWVAQARERTNADA